MSVIAFQDIIILLGSPYHEERMAGVLFLTLWAKGETYPGERIKDFFIKHFSGINNWDLIDCSAPVIVGKYCFYFSCPKQLLFAKSCIQKNNLWMNRAIIVAS